MTQKDTETKMPGVGQPLGIAIAIGNQKGGTGKSTTTVHLAAALGLRGYRCLVMDLDPSAGATRHLGVPGNSFAGALELLNNDERLANLVVVEGMPKNVELVPSRPQLAELEMLLSKYADRTRLLDGPLAEARQYYDFILLDTAPNAGAVTTIAAYSAAEWCLLAAFPHPLSLAGIEEACRDMVDVREYRNPELETIGVVFGNVDNRVKHLRESMADQVAQRDPAWLFETQIAQNVLLARLSGVGITVFQQAGHERLPVAGQYRRLALEVEHRALNREEFLDGKLDRPDWSILDRERESEQANELMGGSTHA